MKDYRFMKRFGIYIVAFLFIFIIIGALPSDSEWLRDLIIYSIVIILLIVSFSVKGTNACPQCRGEIPNRRYLFKSDKSLITCPYCSTKLKVVNPFPGWYRFIFYSLLVLLVIASVNFISLSSRLSNMLQGLIAILFPAIWIKISTKLEKSPHE